MSMTLAIRRRSTSMFCFRSVKKSGMYVRNPTTNAVHSQTYTPASWNVMNGDRMKHQYCDEGSREPPRRVGNTYRIRCVERWFHMPIYHRYGERQRRREQPHKDDHES